MIWVLRGCVVVCLMFGMRDAGELIAGRPATIGNVAGLILSVVVVVAYWAILRWMLTGREQR